ncbi:MAG TPA: hypothetical protein VH880_02440 [Anaeromyxobacteraceae bacterium]
MSDRLRRFEHLERPRRDGPDGDERPSAGERIQGVEAHGGPAGGPAVPGEVRRRFEPPRPRLPEVADASGDEQPFTRCQRCQTDSSRYAATCTTCGEDLRTPEQRAYNERLWAEHRRERDEIDAANAERRAEAEKEEAEAAKVRRQAAEEMAREVGDQERDRLERDGLGGQGWPRSRRGGPWGAPPPGFDPTPWGIRLLRLIRNPLWRVVAIGAVLAAVVGVLLLARNPLVLVLVVSVVLSLFTPRRTWRRGPWW